MKKLLSYIKIVRITKVIHLGAETQGAVTEQSEQIFNQLNELWAIFPQEKGQSD